MKALLILALLLTPFSTGVNSGLPVISFGLPFLVMALFVSLLSPVNHSLHLPRAVIPPLLCGAAVVAAIMLFAFAAPFPDKSLARLAPNLIGYLIVLRLLSIYRIETGTLFDLAVKMLVLSGAVMALYYLINLAFSIQAHGAFEVMKDRSVNGLAALPWGASNMISAALLFPHVACHLLRFRHGGKWPGIVLALILCTVVATISRTGMIVHLAMLIVGCLYTRNYRYMAYGMSTGFLLICMFAIIVPDSFEFLIDARFNPERDLSNGRLESFSYKTAYIARNIMAPVGYYGSLFVFDGLTSHNFILTVLVEQGIVGFAAVLVFLATCWLTLFHRRRLDADDKILRRVLASGAILAFLNLQVEDANFSQPYIIYFWAYFLSTMAFAASVGKPFRTGAEQARMELSHA